MPELFERVPVRARARLRGPPRARAPAARRHRARERRRRRAPRVRLPPVHLACRARRASAGRSSFRRCAGSRSTTIRSRSGRSSTFAGPALRARRARVRRRLRSGVRARPLRRGGRRSPGRGRVPRAAIRTRRCSPPATRPCICFEPMAAPPNALRSGSGLRLLAPGANARGRASPFAWTAHRRTAASPRPEGYAGGCTPARIRRGMDARYATTAGPPISTQRTDPPGESSAGTAPTDEHEDAR